ncbi:hypothetical protein [Chromobacterium subtsugae]|nr:hypothetical protein [Chromobacterium subtsugae]
MANLLAAAHQGRRLNSWRIWQSVLTLGASQQSLTQGRKLPHLS